MRIVLIVFLFLSCSRLIAQNGDCNTAISVCNTVYAEDNAPTGTGNVVEMAPGSCQTGGEFNSSWYVFTVQEDGTLSFVLDPNDNWDDYDWSLFDISDNGCAGINSGQSPEVSCNSYGSFFGIPGATGMSTAMGGSGTSNGPGETFGPPFNADHPVTAGQTYALVVMNWSGSTNGYNLDFSSANTSIFDNVPPTLVSVENSWCTGEVILTFSEEVNLAGLNASNFGFLEPGYNVTNIQAQSSTTHSNQIILTVNNGQLTESVQLTLVTNNNAQLNDMCGNALAMPLVLDLNGEFNYTVETTPACNGSGGTLNVSIAQNADYVITVNGGAVTNFPMQNLADGPVIVSVTDGGGCSKNTNTTIPNTIVSVSLPQDVVLCSMNTTLTAQYQGEQIQWQPQAGIVYGGASQASTLVTASEPIQYNIAAVAQTGTCTATDNILVTFNIPPSVEILTEEVSCYGACDGSINVINANNNSITIFIGTNSSTGTNPSLENVCAGNHELTIVHGPQCFSVYPVSIFEPPQVVADFDASSWTVTTEEPVVLLTSTSVNAASLQWRLDGSNEVLSTADSWEIVMPRVPGTYEIELLATDLYGCIDLFEGSIVVESQFYLFVPNTFTPNNDGINDVFRVAFSDEPVYYRLQVFNRHGNVVFDTTDHEKAWTGNVDNVGEYYCPNGSYSWRILAKAKEQVEMLTFEGHLNIYR